MQKSSRHIPTTLEIMRQIQLYMETRNILKRIGSLVFIGAALTAAGCSGSGSGGPRTGTLSLQITDGPVETAEHVYIQFSGLELQGEGQRTTLYYCQDPADATKTVVTETACTTLPAPKQLDLWTLSGGQADFLRLHAPGRPLQLGPVDGRYRRFARFLYCRAGWGKS